jgi:hypothetical protein
MDVFRASENGGPQFRMQMQVENYPNLPERSAVHAAYAHVNQPARDAQARAAQEEGFWTHLMASTFGIQFLGYDAKKRPPLSTGFRVAMFARTSIPLWDAAFRTVPSAISRHGT